jgi:hypothetical protein
LDGKSARPPKSSDSLTVLLAGGAGCGAGVGAGDGVGVAVDAVCDVGASLVVLERDEGPMGAAAGSLPQPEIRPQTTTDNAAAEQIHPLDLWDNPVNEATFVPANNAWILRQFAFLRARADNNSRSSARRIAKKCL